MLTSWRLPPLCHANHRQHSSCSPCWHLTSLGQLRLIRIKQLSCDPCSRQGWYGHRQGSNSRLPEGRSLQLAHMCTYVFIYFFSACLLLFLWPCESTSHHLALALLCLSSEQCHHLTWVCRAVAKVITLIDTGRAYSACNAG